MLDKASIIDQHDLTFDPGDKRNGSLYLGVARAGGSMLVSQTEKVREECDPPLRRRGLR